MSTSSFRSLSPQVRLAVLRNRVVAAVWLLILTGAVTAADPFTRIVERTGVSLGLLLPPALVGALALRTGSMPHIMLALACGAVLVALGTSLSVTRRMPAAIAAALLFLDLLLVAPSDGRDALSSFPVLVRVAIRLTAIYYVIGAWRAVGMRVPLSQHMADEDAAYEATRARTPAINTGGKWKNTEEDDDQG